MGRTKESIQPDAILTADWHLREDNPVCRTDDYVNETQWDKVRWVADLQVRYNVPVLHSGDLFHYWKPSPELLSKTSQYLPKAFWSVYGNHDLPQHSLALAEKSGLYNLIVNGKVKLLPNASWGQVPDEFCQYSFWTEHSMLVWHVMTYQGKEPWPGCTDSSARKLLKKYPQYDLILTGDNHVSFVEEYDGRILVNPGSLSRQTAAQADHQPSVYLYFAKTNSVKRVQIPIKSDVIDRSHLDIVKFRDERIDSFISKLNVDWDAAMNFEDNLEIFRKKNNVKKSIMELIYKAIEV